MRWVRSATSRLGLFNRASSLPFVPGSAWESHAALRLNHIFFRSLRRLVNHQSVVSKRWGLCRLGTKGRQLAGVLKFVRCRIGLECDSFGCRFVHEAAFLRLKAFGRDGFSSAVGTKFAQLFLWLLQTFSTQPSCSLCPFPHSSSQRIEGRNHVIAPAESSANTTGAIVIVHRPNNDSCAATRT